MSIEFERLFQEYNDYAEASTKILKTMLDVISKGNAPSEESIKELNISINILGLKYAEICSATKTILIEEELPEEGSSIDKYHQAVNNSKTLQLQNRLQLIQDTLNRFISVRSFVNTYSDALAPFQARALDILSMISGNDSCVVDDLEKDTEGPTLFLEALDCQDLDSPEGLNLLEKVGAVYPRHVEIGLTRQKYYVDEHAIIEIKSEATDKKSEKSNYKSGIPTPETKEKTSDKKEDKIVASEFVHELKKHGLFEYETGSLGELRLEYSPDAESKKISTSIFINELKKSNNTAAVKIFIQELVKKSYISVEYIKKAASIPDAIADRAVEYLYYKGYVRKYVLTSGGSFFVKSPRLNKALEQRDACRFIEVTQQKAKNIGNSIADKVTSANARLTYTNLICQFTDYIFSSGIKSFSEVSNFGTEDFRDYILTADGRDVLTICAFWDNDAECDDFLEQLKIFFDSNLPLNLVVAAIDKERAKKYTEAFIQCTEKGISESNISLYSLKDNEYYDYCSGNIRTISEVIPTITEVQPEDNRIGGNQSSKKNEGEHDASNDRKDSSITEEYKEIIVEDNPHNPRKNIKKVEYEENDTIKKDNTASPKNEPVIDKPQNEEEKLAVEDCLELMQGLIAGSISPSEDNLKKVINNLLCGKIGNRGTLSNVLNATILAKTTASYYKDNDLLTQKANSLVLATHMPLWRKAYTSDVLSTTLTGVNDEYIILACYLQALLYPENIYDFALKQQVDYYLANYETNFPSLKSVKALFNKMATIRDVVPVGFSESVMALLGDAKERQKYTQDLQHKAKNLLVLPNINTHLRQLPIMYNACFGNGSELYDCMNSIAQNEMEECDYVKEVLLQYCEESKGKLSISEEKINDILDDAWNKANSNHFALEYGARQQAIKHFRVRLDLMKTWIEHTEQQQGGKLDINRINRLRREIIELASKAKQDISELKIEGSSVLYYALNYIEGYLSNPSSVKDLFAEYIYTGIFTCDDSGIPVFDDSLNAVKYYEPWRNMLRHIITEKRSAEGVREAIVEETDSNIFDNLHQLNLLSALSVGDVLCASEQQIREATVAADDRTTKFRENLELAFTYNRISEPEKENLAGIMEFYHDSFYETLDFGCWRSFLMALEQNINELAEKKKESLRKELEARKAELLCDESSTILAEAEMLLENDMNFAVTEEYFNRFDNGEREFSEELYAIMHETDSFADFVSDEVFIPLQQECNRHSGKAVKSFAWNYLDSRVPKEWSSRQREDSRRLVENWPTRRDQTQATSIANLMSCLGFTVKDATKGTGKKEEYFNVFVEPVAKSMSDYRHPISIMGTQLTSPLKVVVLYGNYAPQQLVDTISSLDFGSMVIVLIDRSVDRTARRQIGEIFHTKTSGQNPFLLIDQILLLYLAKYQITERLPVLLKCTLPYTSYQPFVRDGGSTTDEMFFGRTRELATILDPNGASIVYGGRQLGKTALLQRAESRRLNPENGDYAVYINIINCYSEKELVEKVCEDISRKTGLSMTKTDSIEKLCQQFDSYFRRGKIKTMLLLLDEADNFLATISADKYRQLQAFIDLKRETTNRFKFVIAGLHNVCRAKNATINNGVFGQLGTPLCVKPLSPTDALQLLSRPLKYLGFEIDRYPHLETILTNTNYYPGILQFFGYMLVEAFMTQYGRYYGTVDGNPPFTLQDEQLGAVMNSADLNRSIKDKFRWSLELDPRYFMIARCIAIMYFLRDENTDNWLGFSVEDIKDMADIYDIHCLDGATKEDYINLLDEMYEMGILSKPTSALYRLRRNSFVSIIGTDFETLDAEIKAKNEVDYHA